MMRKQCLALSLAAALLLCSCESKSQTGDSAASQPTTTTTVAATTPTQSASEMTTTAVTTLTTAATTASAVKTTPAVSSAPTAQTDATKTTPAVTAPPEVYKDYPLTDAEQSFLARTCFVGDSICSGLNLYQLIGYPNILAQVNVAVRTVLQFQFNLSGGRATMLPTLQERKPAYVLFWMGMNDVPVYTPEAYAKKYASVLEQTEAACPDAQLVVLSISPISTKATFCTNEQIDAHNQAVKAMIAGRTDKKWLYVDVSAELKNAQNTLKTNYTSTDGIHLKRAAYPAVVWQVCKGIDFASIDAAKK